MNNNTTSKLSKAKTAKMAAKKKPMKKKDVTQEVVPRSKVTVITEPKMMNLQGNKVRIIHREFVEDVDGSIEFDTDSYSINPGLATTFPWLSGVAARFEKYTFKKLHFIYEPASPVTAAGTVMGAFDTDASDVVPSTKQSLMSFKSATRCAPWGEYRCVFPLEAEGTRYIRTSSAPLNTDIKTYDVGVFYAATQGTTATDLGELYVEYDVILEIPQSGTPLVVASMSQSSTGNLNNIVTYGNAPLRALAGNVGVGAFFVPPGLYFLSMCLRGALVSPPSITVDTGFRWQDATITGNFGVLESSNAFSSFNCILTVNKVAVNVESGYEDIVGGVLLNFNFGGTPTLAFYSIGNVPSKIPIGFGP